MLETEVLERISTHILNRPDKETEDLVDVKLDVDDKGGLAIAFTEEGSEAK